MSDYPWEKLLDSERTKMETKIKVGRPVGRPSLTTPTANLHLEVSIETKEILEEILKKLGNINTLSRSRIVSFSLFSLSEVLSKYSDEELLDIKTFYDLRQKIEGKKAQKTTLQKKEVK